RSIYRLFIKNKDIQCRLCGLTKFSAARALSCVRSHLNHRPFHCSGPSVGCKICSETLGY
ncbi:hypothetical protein CPB86DRAFT_664742, partial [Serendipita vermifera]